MRAGDVVILAVPDVLMGEIAARVIPQMRPGSLLMTLDPAAPLDGQLPLRHDIACVVAHPCHPSVFNWEPTEAAFRDFYGGISARQAIVCALMQGDEDQYRLGVDVASTMYAPVSRVHRVTLEQMAMLVPALVETLAQTCMEAVKEGYDRLVEDGVPAPAVRDFVLGHLRIQIAVLFGEVNGTFSERIQNRRRARRCSSGTTGSGSSMRPTSASRSATSYGGDRPRGAVAWPVDRGNVRRRRVVRLRVGGEPCAASGRRAGAARVARKHALSVVQLGDNRPSTHGRPSGSSSSRAMRMPQALRSSSGAGSDRNTPCGIPGAVPAVRCETAPLRGQHVPLRAVSRRSHRADSKRHACAGRCGCDARTRESRPRSRLPSCAASSKMPTPRMLGSASTPPTPSVPARACPP